MNGGQNDHIVSSFDADLSKLDSMIAEMGGLAGPTESEHWALCRRDTAADKIVPADKRIDDLRRRFTIHREASRAASAYGGRLTDCNFRHQNFERHRADWRL